MINNANDMLSLLRDFVGEATAAQWTDINLMRRINMAYSDVARMVSKSKGQWLVKSENITAVSSALTLPDDCAKPVYLEDGHEGPVSFIGSVAQRALSRTAGIFPEAYLLKDSIELNSASDSGTYKLWYQQRICQLTSGTASAGGVGTLTLQASNGDVTRDDYYNGAYLDVIDGTVPGRYLITDYVASTRVLTLDTTETFSTDKYGLVPIVPDECYNFIILQATLLALAKPSSSLDENVLKMYIDREKRERREVTEWLENRITENSGIDIGEYS